MARNTSKLVAIPGELHSAATDGIVTATEEVFDYDSSLFQSQINSNFYNASQHLHEITEVTTTARTVVYAGNITSGFDDASILSDNTTVSSTRTETSTGQTSDSSVDSSTRTYDDTVNQTTVVWTTIRTKVGKRDDYTFEEAVNSVPASYRHGGLNLSFISNESLTFVKYFLLNSTWSVGEGNWIFYDSTIFDISANHSGATYADLATALGTNGANVPSAVRKGGMSIRFINSDGKYEQGRYMGTSIANADFVNVCNWQGVDEDVTKDSNNLATSGSVYAENLQNGTCYIRAAQVPAFEETWSGNSKSIKVTLPSFGLRVYDTNGVGTDLAVGSGIYTITSGKMLVYNRTDGVYEVIDYNGTNTDKYYVLLAVSAQAVYGLLAPYYYAWKDKSEYVAYIPNTYSLNGEYDGATCKVYAQDVNCSIRLYNKSGNLAILLDNDYTIDAGHALVVDLADSNTIKIIQFVNVNIFDNTIVLISNLRGALGGLLAGFIYEKEIEKRQKSEEIINFYPNNILLGVYSGGLTPSSRTVGDTVTVSSYTSDGYRHYVMKCNTGTKLNVDITSPAASRPALFITDLNGKLTYCSGKTIKDVITISADSWVYINTTSPTSNSYRKDQYVYSNRNFEDYNLFETANPYGISIDDTNVGNPSKCVGTYDNTNHTYKSVGTLVYAGEIIHVSGNAGSSGRVALGLIDRKTSKLIYKHPGQTFILSYIVTTDCYLIVNDSKITTDGYTNPFLSISGVDKAEAMNRRRVIIESGNPLYLGNNDDYKIKDYIDNDLRSRIVSMFGTRHAPANANVAMIHFSDLHGFADGIAALLEFRNMYYGEIKEIINTGDTVASLYDDGSWDAVAAVNGYGGILNAIGNHDGALSVEGVTDWEAVPKTDVYNRYIKPYVSNWNVTQPSNAETNGYCWYYKDYSAPNSIYTSTPTAEGAIAGIRLIVLDCIQTDLTAQTTWLVSVLESARTSKMAVVIAQHCRADGTMQKIDGFNTGLIPDTFYNNPPAVEAVDTFIENGGIFVCWIGGHTHFDSTQIITNHHDQISIVISTDGGTGRLCDYKKEEHHESINLFNLIAFNTEAKLIKVLRIGAHISERMQDNRSYSVNWETKEVWR